MPKIFLSGLNIKGDVRVDVDIQINKNKTILLGRNDVTVLPKRDIENAALKFTGWPQKD